MERPFRYFAADFLDTQGNLDHNTVGTLEDIFAEAKGRVVVVQSEVSYNDYQCHLAEQL